MINFFFYISFLDFLLLEVYRQNDIPLVGDYKLYHKFVKPTYSGNIVF